MRIFYFRKRLKRINEKISLYQNIDRSEIIYNYQLKKFNRIWEHAYTTIPFYKKLKKDYKLPDQIENSPRLPNYPP